MLTSFDHVTIVVNQVDVAIQCYERLLGTAPTWLGTHPELGTRSAIFGLSNALIELVGPDGHAAEAEGLRALLATRGEGIHAIAFATNDALACSEEFRERGLRVTAPQSGEARAQDGATRQYRTVELSPRQTRGVQVLAVERSDLLALRAAEPPEPDAVDALDHVVIRTADPEAALGLYGRRLGIRLALSRALSGHTRMLFFRIGGVTIEAVEDASLAESDAFHGLAYRVSEIETAHARLLGLGFALSEVREGNKPGTRVFSVRDGTCGVPTLILRDPARDTAGRPEIAP
jgi:catechol 2,3-dioxygenase-like lactoylglutathione lyase family enzyme